MKLFSKINRNDIGKQAEKRATSYLKRQGLRLVELNYHCRFGEIDIIMRNNDTYIFIEVRYRAEGAQVNAVESITSKKMKKIRKTAEYYMMRFDEAPNCRFDVIAMTHNQKPIRYNIEWIKNAF